MNESPDVLPLWTRLLLFAGLLAAAGLALPVSAYVVEAVSSRAENWIVVVYFAVVVIVGAAIGMTVRGSSTAATARGRALRWAGGGVLAAAVGYVVWLLLIAG